MGEQTRAIRCALIGMGVLALGAGGAQGQWHYYYFKDKRPLKLDVNRVALLRPAAPSQLAALSRAAGFSPRGDTNAANLPKSVLADAPRGCFRICGTDFPVGHVTGWKACPTRSIGWAIARQAG